MPVDHHPLTCGTLQRRTPTVESIPVEGPVVVGVVVTGQIPESVTSRTRRRRGYWPRITMLVKVTTTAFGGIIRLQVINHGNVSVHRMQNLFEFSSLCLSSAAPSQSLVLSGKHALVSHRYIYLEISGRVVRAMGLLDFCTFNELIC